jgi:hypothetical protein
VSRVRILPAPPGEAAGQWPCSPTAAGSAMTFVPSWRRGNFEVAGAAISYARSVARELGATHMLAVLSLPQETSNGTREISPPRSVSVEPGTRPSNARGHTPFEPPGPPCLLSLVRLGRAGEEALELTRESKSLATEDDITAQIPWREARARILARRGRTDVAEKLAREAVEIAEGTDLCSISRATRTWRSRTCFDWLDAGTRRPTPRSVPSIDRSSRATSWLQAGPATSWLS